MIYLWEKNDDQSSFVPCDDQTVDNWNFILRRDSSNISYIFKWDKRKRERVREHCVTDVVEDKK